MAQDSVFRRTDTGEKAMRGQAGQIAPELIRVLALVSGDTHFDLIKKRAIRMPEPDLRAALDRLVTGGFLVASGAKSEHDLDFTAHFDKPLNAPALSEDEKRSIAMAATDGHDVLTKTGSFLRMGGDSAMTTLGKSWTEITVLIIEDDEIQARFAQNIIMKAGFKQRHAGTREEIIGELNKSPLPDCVLLDIELPGTNGFDILARMRQHPRLKPVPVIMLTAMASQQDVYRGISLGAAAYVSKPYKKQTLVDTIVKTLGLKPLIENSAAAGAA